MQHVPKRAFPVSLSLRSHGLHLTYTNNLDLPKCSKKSLSPFAPKRNESTRDQFYQQGSSIFVSEKRKQVLISL